MTSGPTRGPNRDSQSLYFNVEDSLQVPICALRVFLSSDVYVCSSGESRIRL